MFLAQPTNVHISITACDDVPPYMLIEMTRAECRGEDEEELRILDYFKMLILAPEVPFLVPPNWLNGVLLANLGVPEIALWVQKSKF